MENEKSGKKNGSTGNSAEMVQPQVQAGSAGDGGGKDAGHRKETRRAGPVKVTAQRSLLGLVGQCNTLASIMNCRPGMFATGCDEQVYADVANSLSAFVTAMRKGRFGLPQEDDKLLSKAKVADHRIISDIPMRVVFNQQHDLVRQLVEDLTGEDLGVVKTIKTQYGVINNGGRRKMVLDMLLGFERGDQLDIEGQKYIAGISSDRTIVHLGDLTWDSLFTGSDFSDLKDQWIIFLCENDPTKTGRLLVKEPVLSMTPQIGRAKLHAVYRFCSNRYNEEGKPRAPEGGIDPARWDRILTWANDLLQDDWRKVANAELRERLRAVTETQEKEVCELNEAFMQAMEEYAAEKAAEAAKQAVADQEKECAARLLKLGCSEQLVSEGTGLSLEEVSTLKADLIA